MDLIDPNYNIPQSLILNSPQTHDSQNVFLDRLKIVKGFKSCSSYCYHGYTLDGKQIINLDFQEYIDENVKSWYEFYASDEDKKLFEKYFKLGKIRANGYVFNSKSSWKNNTRIVFLFGNYIPIFQIRIELLDEPFDSTLLQKENYSFHNLQICEANKIDSSTLKKINFRTLNASFIALQCSNLESDHRFILASDNRTKSLILFNKHLRVVGQFKIQNMIANFPYIKVKKNTIAFVTNLEDMKYNFLGQSNGFVITRFEVKNDPYEDKEEFENLIMGGQNFIHAQEIEVNNAKQKMNLSQEKKSKMHDKLRIFFADNYIRWTGTLLLRYAIMVKNSALRQYEAVPVTFIPGF